MAPFNGHAFEAVAELELSVSPVPALMVLDHRGPLKLDALRAFAAGLPEEDRSRLHQAVTPILANRSEGA